MREYKFLIASYIFPIVKMLSEYGNSIYYYNINNILPPE